MARPSGAHILHPSHCTHGRGTPVPISCTHLICMVRAPPCPYPEPMLSHGRAGPCPYPAPVSQDTPGCILHPPYPYGGAGPCPYLAPMTGTPPCLYPAPTSQDTPVPASLHPPCPMAGHPHTCILHPSRCTHGGGTPEPVSCTYLVPWQGHPCACILHPPYPCCVGVPTSAS